MKNTLRAALAAVLVPLSLLGSEGAADATLGAATPDTSGSTKIVVADETGDVYGDGDPVAVTGTDITRVRYTTGRDTIAHEGGRMVQVVITHEAANPGAVPLRAVTKFTAGPRKFKAIYGATGLGLFVRKDGDWVKKDTGWMACDFNDTTMVLSFPTSALNGVSALANLQTILRTDDTDLYDLTTTSTVPLRLVAVR